MTSLLEGEEVGQKVIKINGGEEGSLAKSDRGGGVKKNLGALSHGYFAILTKNQPKFRRNNPKQDICTQNSLQ